MNLFHYHHRLTRYSRTIISHCGWNILPTLLIISFTAANLLSQPISPKKIRDSKGVDFWIGFPPNFHNSTSNLDKISIIISAERPTTGEISAVDNSGKVFHQPFAINDVNQVYTLELSSFGLYEIYNNEFPTNVIFHITALDEITVYGLSLASQTTDAFLAFPTDVLGSDYVVASYNSDGANTGNNFPTPSQFLVIATVDSTDVVISPSVPTAKSPNKAPYTVRLHRGQGYLVQATLGFGNQYNDLTGTRVRSTAPIAVFGSHQRSLIPIAIRTGGAPGIGVSRDFLMEQMLPVTTWGYNAFIAPYPHPANGTPDGNGDLYRIIAALDSTEVFVNERRAGIINANDFLESVINTTGASVRATKPIMVVGYKRTAGGLAAAGDPFMAIFPPAEQFLSRYRFLSVQGKQRVGGNQNTNEEDAFRSHYVSIVVPTTKATTVVLDGTTLNLSSFTPIGNTGYSFANISVIQGVHNIKADTAFGITAMGYGGANSYGYIAGMRFETDLVAPRIIPGQTCAGLLTTIYDNLPTDSKIFWWDTPKNSWKNVNVQILALPRPADSLQILSPLTNIYEDGEYDLTVIDSLDLKSVQKIVVPGFTVHVNPEFRGNQVATFSTNALALAAGSERCVSLQLVNYGSTNQTISRVSSINRLPEFSFQIPNSLTLKPGETKPLPICFKADKDGLFRDTLVINDGCRDRKIVIVEAESRFDRDAPTITQVEDSCNHVNLYTFTDNRKYDAGVDSVRILKQDNCKITTKRLPDGELQTGVEVLDPRRDTFFTLQIRDSVGNISTVDKSIPGFNIRFELSEPGNYNFGGVNARSVTCETVTVVNNGLLPFVMDKTLLFDNTTFSIPPSQIPLLIPPGESRKLTMCFAPMLSKEYRDTISVTKFCVTEQFILQGQGVLGASVSDSRCSAELLFRAIGSTVASVTAQQTVQIEVFPNPAIQSVTLRLTLLETRHLQLRIVSHLGVPLLTIPEQEYAPGIWDVVVNTSTLEIGNYLYEVKPRGVAGERKTGILQIVR